MEIENFSWKMEKFALEDFFGCFLVFFVLLVYSIGNLPKLASYVLMYSLVMNCETKAVLPTPESPRRTTRYFGISSISLSELSPATPWPLQQEPSNGDRSPETLLFLQRFHKGNSISIRETKVPDRLELAWGIEGPANARADSLVASFRDCHF